MKSAATWVLGLAILVAALLQPPLAWGQLRIRSGALKSGAEHPKSLEKRVFQLTNEARRKNGLSLLEADNSLISLAREKGDDLIKSHRVNQTEPHGKKPPISYSKDEPARIKLLAKAGENIHMSLNDDYSDLETATRLIVNGFMGAPGPRSNILNPAFTHLGVGVSIKGNEGYIIQEFGPRDRRLGEVQKSRH